MLYIHVTHMYLYCIRDEKEEDVEKNKEKAEKELPPIQEKDETVKVKTEVK